MIIGTRIGRIRRIFSDFLFFLQNTEGSNRIIREFLDKLEHGFGGCDGCFLIFYFFGKILRGSKENCSENLCFLLKSHAKFLLLRIKFNFNHK